MEPESEDNDVNEALMNAIRALCDRFLIKAYKGIVKDMEGLKKNIQSLCSESNLTKTSATTLVQSLLDKAIENGHPVYPDTPIAEWHSGTNGSSHTDVAHQSMYDSINKVSHWNTSINCI